MRATLTRLAAAAAMAILAAPAAWAQDADHGDGDTEPVDFLVEPGADAATSPRGGWFVLDLDPGAEARQELVVHNRGDEPIELALAAVDADTGPTGGASYRRLGEPVEATGAWITLDRDRVRLEPGATESVGFTVTVPDDADSGEHLAGIAAWVPDDVEEVEEAPGAVIAVEQRRVVAVQVTLPGPAEPILRIDEVEPRAHAGGVRLMVHIANDGRGLTSGEGVIEVADPAFEQTFAFGTFVPRTTIAYPIPWVEGRPAEGTYQARVQLEHGMWTETWEGTFTVGEDITGELDRLEVDGPALPWRLLAIAAAAVLALAAAGWGVVRLTRRPRRPRQPRRRQPASWSGPAPSASSRR